jgi:hypothetical protein
VRLFDDAAVDALVAVRYPLLRWGVFARNAALRVQQLDIWRLLAVHALGGIYVDLDVELGPAGVGFGRLLAAHGPALLLPAEYYWRGARRRAKCAAMRAQGRFPRAPACGAPGAFTLGNYFVAAPAGHAALASLIAAVVAAMRRHPRVVEGARDGHQFADVHTYLTTGPDQVTAWYYARLLGKGDGAGGGEGGVVAVVHDPRERDNRIGVFARHLAKGSWKPPDE